MIVFPWTWGSGKPNEWKIKIKNQHRNNHYTGSHFHCPRIILNGLNMEHFSDNREDKAYEQKAEISEDGCNDG